MFVAATETKKGLQYLPDLLHREGVRTNRGIEVKKILKTIQCCAKWDDEEQRRRINLTGASKRKTGECIQRMLSVKQDLLRNQAFCSGIPLAVHENSASLEKRYKRQTGNGLQSPEDQLLIVGHAC